MIRIENLTKRFNPGKPNETIALNNISLQINKGEFVVIVGANGSGKSTLLNAISGSLLVSSGELFIENEKVTNLPEHHRSQWIARVFQNPLSGTASELTILENFRLASIRTRPKTLRIGMNSSFTNQVKEKISSLGMGLEDKVHLPIGALSGGQRQALTILMSVMDELKILLLDEPSAALDPRSAEMVMKITQELIDTHALTAILITHNIKDAWQYGNRIIQMNEGKIIRDHNSTQKPNITSSDIFNWFL
ncbi:MAG: ecfA2 [Sphingobacteriales bacterium]|nr:ecfA2 [Sphingobacteriales bacterium]